MRPTEEESILQTIQLLPDQDLRPEFVDSANKLRNKIFKKVKPKILNGKFITGEMLLELWHSYVKAVNKGTVPSIKSAWSYVCMNECQRAIESAIQAYEQEMWKYIEQAKQEENIIVIEQAQEVIYEEILSIFKQKAVGDTLSFEASLRHEISQKYNEIRKQFNFYCEANMEKKYTGLMNQIKRSSVEQIHNTKIDGDSSQDKTVFRDKLNTVNSNVN